MKYSHEIKKLFILPLLTLLIISTTGCDSLFNDYNDPYYPYQNYDQKKRSYSKDEIMYDGPDDYSFDESIEIEAEVKNNLNLLLNGEDDTSEVEITEKEKTEINKKYKEVLTGEADIAYYTCDATCDSVINYQAGYYYYDNKKITDYSVEAIYRIDLDRDGSKEVILKIDEAPDYDPEGNYENLLILHYYDGKVYGNKMSFNKLDYLGENGVACDINHLDCNTYVIFTFDKNEFYINTICYEYYINEYNLYEEDTYDEEDLEVYQNEDNKEKNYYYLLMGSVEQELFKKIEHYLRESKEAESYPINGVISEEDINKIF